MTSDHPAQATSSEDAVSRTFLHQGSEPSERVEPPLLVTSASFRLLWVALVVVTGTLVLVGSVVAGRVA